MILSSLQTIKQTILGVNRVEFHFQSGTFSLFYILFLNPCYAVKHTAVNVTVKSLELVISRHIFDPFGLLSSGFGSGGGVESFSGICNVMLCLLEKCCFLKYIVVFSMSVSQSISLQVQLQSYSFEQKSLNVKLQNDTRRSFASTDTQLGTHPMI